MLNRPRSLGTQEARFKQVAKYGFEMKREDLQKFYFWRRRSYLQKKIVINMLATQSLKCHIM